MAGLQNDATDGTQSADGIGSADRTASHALDPRRYQIEMFEASMRENIIVAMDTGSGKTMVSRLRIEAELLRSPGKRIWFTTPNVLLAHQQYQFFRSQLPSFSFRLITGTDNVDFWSTQQVWDSVLAGKHGVVSTPEVLRSALQHGFVLLSDISLLVFDEAHHCMKKSPTNQIMKMWYHPLKQSQPCRCPAILGLTASPVVQNCIGAIPKLEQNLDAVCRSPTINIEEYRSFVHMPSILPLDFARCPTLPSTLLPILGRVIQEYSITTDPVCLRLNESTSLSDKVRMQKILTKNETPILKEMKRLFNNAEHIQEQIGASAADRYILTCVNIFSDSHEHRPLVTLENLESIHLHATLSPISLAIPNLTSSRPALPNLSGKALALVSYLAENWQSSDAAIIFVERRATAWALRELFLSLESLTFLKPCALSGIRNAFGRGLADLVDQQMPQNELGCFHEGTLNLCIATSVLEEGIDVQACNIVICFDDSPNVKSFIQRRGRARHPGSRYVILQDPTSDLLSKYHALEDSMKAEYADLDRKIRTLEEHELVIESSDLLYCVQLTGAILSIDQACGHLAHFCSKLRRREGRSNTEPIYIMDGGPGERVSCRVILPASLPPHLQEMKSSTWRTEKMARKEAAFLVYVELHKHGLLSDHLLPFVNEPRDQKIEGMSSFSVAAPVMNPWSATQGMTSQSHEHQIKIRHPQLVLPTLLLLLPVALCSPLVVSLFGIATATATVSARSQNGGSQYDQNLSNMATKLLFSSVLKRRLSAVNVEELEMPYYVIPDILVNALESWIESAKSSCPAKDFDFKVPGRSSYLIRRLNEPTPYIYSVPEPIEDKATTPRGPNSELDLLRVSRQINFLSPSEKPNPVIRTVHDVSDCSVLGLTPGYAACMTYMPSIMHVVAIAMRAHLARLGPLAPIGFKANDETLLSHALTAPGVAQSDYQRLEFVGDSLLKYWVTVHVFALNPYMTENLLTGARNRLVNNARLLQATRNLGLEAYVTTDPFAASKWTLGQKPEPQEPRVMSSKTLADIIEALIGVAYAQSPMMSANSHQIQRSLGLFLPEIPWQIPSDLISQLKATDGGPTRRLNDLEYDHFDSVERLIGYSFTDKAILRTALTHSSSIVGFQTYERLEFLGDAIIDIIVKQKLWSAPLEMSEGEMTARHASLVNKDIFAFLTTKLAVEKETIDERVDLSTKQVHLIPRKERTCLHAFMLSSGDREFIEQRRRFMERYEATNERLEQSLITGQEFPWIDLYHLNAPKWCSDILESIVGSVYVDSGGSLQACEKVLGCTGLMKLVTRAASELDIIYRQPLARLRVLNSHIVAEKRKRREMQSGRLIFDCMLLLDDNELGRFEGASSQPEAENMAAKIVLQKIEQGKLVLEEKAAEV